MLLIQPIQDKTVQEALCRLCGTLYRPEMLAYFAADGDDRTFEPTRMLGLCQFSADGAIADLRFAPGVRDEEAMQIMGKTAMNFLYRCGCHESVLLPGACDDSLAEKLCYFPGSDGRRRLSLDLFYKSPCGYRETIRQGKEQKT